MKFKDILDHLSKRTLLPIKPDDIASFIIARGHVEKIVYVGVNLDTSILRGGYIRSHYEESHSGPIPPPYAIPDSGVVIKVYYAQNQDADYMRLVVNKELLHLIDPDVLRTSTPEKVKTLIRHLRLPRELRQSLRGIHTVEAMVDYLSDYRAVIAMVPQTIREAICDKFDQGKIDEQQIAALVGVPIKYVSFILSDEIWSVVRDMWLEI